jgi:hypothetical protein
MIEFREGVKRLLDGDTTYNKFPPFRNWKYKPKYKIIDYRSVLWRRLFHKQY